MPDYTIREARHSDLDRLVAFTLQEARDAETIDLDVEAVIRGVRAALDDRGLATYWLAETPGGRAVGNVSVVREWSNLHGGHYWWIQSLFIAPTHRGTGLVERLLDHVASHATAAGALDLRLYARTSNERALRAYRRCGFTVAPYIIMARSLKPDQGAS